MAENEEVTRSRSRVKSGQPRKVFKRPFEKLEERGEREERESLIRIRLGISTSEER